MALFRRWAGRSSMIEYISMKGTHMDSLLFALNAVAPIIIMVAIGYILKKIGFMKPDFAKAANKLVFRIFLPAMLFLNVYKIEQIGDIDVGYIIYAAAVVLVIFALSIPLVMIVTKQNERRGPLLQATFRSNYALIGIPLAISLYGEEGSVIASLLSAAIIPLFNILAVISLSIFRKDGEKPSVKKILLDIARNPLVLSVFTGIAVLVLRSFFEKEGVGFRLTDIGPLYQALGYLSDLATPLALLVLGAQFEFSAVGALRKEIIFGTLMRNVIVPIIGVGTAYLFFADRFNAAHFAVFVAMFATPIAVSSVPMAQEMDGDAVLAGQLVVWTTVISAFSVFIVSFLLKWAGVFG